MHFLFIIDSLDFGGAERQVVLDANALLRRGHRVTVGYFRIGPMEQELDCFIGRKHIKAKKFHHRILAIRRLLVLLEPDLIIAHMFRAELAAAFGGIGFSIPVIFNEHGLGLWRRSYHTMALRLAASFASEIWCASDACLKVRLNRDRLNSNKLRTVHNCFDLKQDGVQGKQLRSEILSALAKSFDTPVIGFVGRFDSVKRLSLLVNAATHEALSNTVFVIVGDGRERKILEAAVAKKGLDDHFHFPGYVAKPGEYFGVFDVFVLPSKRESLSVALLEAGNAGLPAVAFDVGGNAEIIRHGVTGYVTPEGDFTAFQEALGRLVNSPDLRRNMGRAAKERVSKVFSEQRRMDEILASAKRYVRKGVAM